MLVTAAVDSASRNVLFVFASRSHNGFPVYWVKYVLLGFSFFVCILCNTDVYASSLYVVLTYFLD